MIYHCALNIIRQRPRNEVGYDGIEILEPENDQDRWRREWQLHILSMAMKQLKLQLEDSTFQAFELYAVQGEEPAVVARFLRIPVGMVYVAKSRALALLRKIVRELQEEE